MADRLPLFVPYRLREAVGVLKRRYIWRKAMRDVLLEQPPTLSDAISNQLIYGWGNSDWAADPGFLQQVYEEARNTDGPILECGSGLTTIVAAAAAFDKGTPLVSLEHTDAWAERVRTELRRLRLSNATVLSTTMCSYETFDWYGVSAPIDLPRRVSMVICDGPPGTTRGGRFGLVPVLADRLGGGCVIMLDDFSRPDEQEISRAWLAIRPGEIMTGKSQRGYAKITLY
jgi:hypothetical protein